jgi:hypothetical protein
VEPPSRSTDFVALGHPGSDHYAGLETFANPGVSHVEMTSDELSTICPVTGQPDLYVATPLRTGVQRHRDPTPSPRNLETSKPRPTACAGSARVP